jgi:hypothetical protein
VFEDLLPKQENAKILQLLFCLSHWHALAKLRLHSDLTLILLDEETGDLGGRLGHFRDDICPKFETHELHREADARQKAQVKNGSSNAPSSKRPKGFNLNTYKVHSIGDYVDTIRQSGTTDSYTTEPAECFH